MGLGSQELGMIIFFGAIVFSFYVFYKALPDLGESKQAVSALPHAQPSETAIIIQFIGSIIVIISYFLPWFPKTTGADILQLSIRAFDMARWSNDWIVVGGLGILLSTSPVFFHAINIMVLTAGYDSFPARYRHESLACTLIPVVIWVIFILYVIVVGTTSDAPSIPISSLPIDIKTESIFKIGVGGTFLGQLITVGHHLILNRGE